MKDYAKSFIIKRCSSKLALEDLLENAASLCGKKEVVQLFDPGKVINRMHLIGAYVNSIEAFKNRSNISKSVAIEMLLFASMSTQINLAIDMMGAKKGSDFILFSTSKNAHQKAESMLSKESEFAPSKKEQIEKAKLFGITQSKELDQFVLQKIAVSRLDG